MKMKLNSHLTGHSGANCYFTFISTHSYTFLCEYGVVVMAGVVLIVSKSVPVCPSLSQSVPVCPKSVSVRPSPSRRSRSVQVCPSLSQSVPVFFRNINTSFVSAPISERTIDCRDRDRAQGTPAQAPDSGVWFPGRQAVAQTGRQRCPHVARTLPAHCPNGVPTLPATTKQASPRDSSTCRWGSEDRHSRNCRAHGVFFCFLCVWEGQSVPIWPSLS